MARKPNPQQGLAFDWTFPQPDWQDRIRQHQVPIDLAKLRPYLNTDRADRARAILNNLRLADVPDQPRMMQAGGEWFFQIAEVIAGSVLKDGKARISDVLIQVPKKNSKTTFGGLLMLSLMLMSPRPRAEFVLIGPTLEIAQLAFNQIAGAIYLDDHLREILHVREHLKTIEHRTSGCRLSCKAFDMQIATGSRPAAYLLDEAWLLKGEDAARVIGQLKGGQASIPEGIGITISTQADQAPQGYWKAELTKARAVRDGTATIPGYLPVMYEPPLDVAADLDRLCQPETWEMVNPNLGKSVDLDWLKASFSMSKAVDKFELQRWLSQHVNAEVTTYAAADDAWGGAEVWDKTSSRSCRFDWICQEAKYLYFGFDGGGGDDLTSLAVIGQFSDDGPWYAATRSWVWPIALERRKSIATQLRDFEKDGDLAVVDVGEDLRQITDIIAAAASAGKFIGCGVDPNGIAADLANALEDAGVERERVIAVKQGFALRPGWLGLERRARQGQLIHSDQAILSWAVSNTKVDPKSGLITKKYNGVGKIDPVVALATAAMVVLDSPPKPWVFDVGALVG
ncbi:terminase TerL endonuclease subunit [Shimia aestuarii]|uniref:Phage terminase-like protein, large subunit, contains N-terminal HTH domain n=1 Tax=Shimia aestuarii TaxID=254406 RepID=A0A1I4NN57_9RHOB|nr:terminase TerL endonuclease subunit [Shimia aestuarii]SFM16760.1 Phage terminase-like protein, large subunit, contains N-terminal HTH domain [Shimia aestuarii]